MTAPWMADFLGFTMLAVGGFLTVFLAAARPGVALPLIVGFAARCMTALVQRFYLPLPDSNVDAARFEIVAWGLANDPGQAFTHLHYMTSYFYSELMAVIYSMVGRSMLLLQGVSVLVGTLCVYLVWKIALEIWQDPRVARVAAWMGALFPTAILYSALTMREMFFDLCLLVGCLAAVRWIKSGRFAGIALAFSAFALGISFHPGIVGAIGVLIAVLMFRLIAGIALGLLDGRFVSFAMVFLIGTVVCLALLLVNDPFLPKFGHLSKLIDPAPYLDILSTRVSGAAAYPDWLVPRAVVDLIWVLPGRVAYFLWAPFPWDVAQPSHLVGALDAALYVLLCALLMANINGIHGSRAALVMFAVLVALTLAFAIGSGNFGTALRHRTKIVFLLIVLAAPAVQRLKELLSVSRIRGTPVALPAAQ